MIAEKIFVSLYSVEESIHITSPSVGIFRATSNFEENCLHEAYSCRISLLSQESQMVDIIVNFPIDMWPTFLYLQARLLRIAPVNLGTGRAAVQETVIRY